MPRSPTTRLRPSARPERGLALAALLLLAACAPETWRAIHLLEDIAAGPRPSTLKAETPAPARRELAFTIEERQRLADRYEPGEPFLGCLVLVPGFTPDGKDDAQLVALAESFARARFRVLVPDVPGSREMRVTLDDAEAIADAARHLADAGNGEPCRDVGIAAISYAVGPAVIAALEPEVDERLGFLVALGGYHDVQAAVTFMTTGHFRESPDRRWRTREPQPFATWIFLRSNLERIEDANDRRLLEAMADRRLRDPQAPIDDLARALGPEGRALYDLIANRDPEQVPELIAALPEDIREQMRALSLAERDLSPLASRLILIHGQADDMIPPTESEALARAATEAELFLIPGFSHVDPGTVGFSGRLALVRALRAVLDRQDASGPDAMGADGPQAML